jgi:hypothetical protein
MPTTLAAAQHAIPSPALVYALVTNVFLSSDPPVMAMPAFLSTHRAVLHTARAHWEINRIPACHSRHFYDMFALHNVRLAGELESATP